jgi:hypothetical protein
MRTSGPERFCGAGDLVEKMEKIKVETDKEWLQEMNRVESITFLIIAQVLICLFSYGSV